MKNTGWPVLIGAVILTILFHEQPAGLNLWIAEALFFGWIILDRQISLRNRLMPVVLSGVLVTLLATVLVHSAFAGWMHAISLLVFAGIMSAPELKSVASALGTGAVNAVMSQVAFVRGVKNFRVGGRNVGSAIWKSRIFIIPLLIIIVFISIYRNASPVFDILMENSLGRLGEWIADLFRNFDFAVVGTFILCLAVSALILVRNRVLPIANADATANDHVQRKRLRQTRKTLKLGLKSEYRAAIFLLVILNLLILILNISDISEVWLSFEWAGQYLKQFVHEGTWLLIFSILISIAIVLWYFRGNLNFFTRNKALKTLSYIWLLQNIILTVSVAIRNFYYISYFSLAYKRIGVIIFLLLTLIGIISVLIKVMQRKSSFYLFRVNALACFIVLVLSSVVNWDVTIARYNFNHASTSFLHLDYLSTLSDKALPYLNKPLDELQKIDTVQKAKFPLDRDYMPPEEYHQIIERRILKFGKRWDSEGWLSWNLPEHMAYRKLFGSKSYELK